MTSYATQSWVMSQNYLTVANMASYTTQAWVTSQNYLFSAVICNYLPLTGGIITDTVYNNTPLKIILQQIVLQIHIHKII